jgi:hypothetical protein
MQGLLLSILIAAGNVSFGNAATVRPMHEWSYEQGADYYLLRYLHEAWDNESTGFTIECRAGNKTTLTINYDVMDDSYFKAYKRKQLKPKIEIRSAKGQVTVLGELDENSLYPQFAFSIPQSSSIDVLKILPQSSSIDVLKILSDGNAVMVFPNRSFKIWQIKRSSEISKFLSACANKTSKFAPMK